MGDEQDSGKYRLLAELGQGGMADVFLAVARGPGGFNKLVVLKMLRSSLATDPSFLAMFLDEARLAARLNHPNVVQTYEIGQEFGRHVIVMEYLEGRTLTQYVERAGDELPRDLHLHMIAEALSGLQYAHELRDYKGQPLNVVHRDMSPHNILVTFEGQVKVLDFGIAKASNSSTETRTGAPKGKIRYMAPEQVLGETLDRRADIYSVGVMLWGAATGRELWKGEQDVVVMNRVANGEIPSPREVRPDVPEELDRICMKALAAAPEDRYPTAADLQHDLERYLRTQPVTYGARDAARMISKVFEDDRKQLSAVVDARLAQVSAGNESGGFQVPSVAELLHVTRTGSSGGTIRTATTTLSGEKSTPRSRPILIGLVLLAVLAAGGWMAARTRGLRADARPGPVLDPHATVVFSISASPRTATIFLDDERLVANPGSKTLPHDGRVHSVRAECQGYVPRSIDVLSDRDHDVDLLLERIVGPPAAQAPASVAASGPRTRTLGRSLPTAPSASAAPQAVTPAPVPQPSAPPTPTPAPTPTPTPTKLPRSLDTGSPY